MTETIEDLRHEIVMWRNSRAQWVKTKEQALRFNNDALYDEALDQIKQCEILSEAARRKLDARGVSV